MQVTYAEYAAAKKEAERVVFGFPVFETYVALEEELRGRPIEELEELWYLAEESHKDAIESDDVSAQVLAGLFERALDHTIDRIS